MKEDKEVLCKVCKMRCIPIKYSSDDKKVFVCRICRSLYDTNGNQIGDY